MQNFYMPFSLAFLWIARSSNAMRKIHEPPQLLLNAANTMAPCLLRHRDLQDATKNHTHGYSSFCRENRELFVEESKLFAYHTRCNIAFERDRSLNSALDFVRSTTSGAVSTEIRNRISAQASMNLIKTTKKLKHPAFR